MANDQQQRLDDAVQRRDNLLKKVERVRGRLQAARAELAAVEDDCKKKGIKPKQLAATIKKLDGRYETTMDKLETDIQDAEQEVAPFLGEEA